jgi:hypothetical protein
MSFILLIFAPIIGNYLLVDTLSQPTWESKGYH